MVKEYPPHLVERVQVELVLEPQERQLQGWRRLRAPPGLAQSLRVR